MQVAPSCKAITCKAIAQGRSGTNLASERYPEGLSAKDKLAGEGQQGGVHCNGQLHGQLWGNDRGHNHGAVQKQLETIAIRILQDVSIHL